MKDPSLFTDLLVLFSLAFGASALMKLLRIPTVVGFLLAGMVAGPTGLDLLGGTEQVKALAEIGVMLLLFTIGLELQTRRLWQLRREGLVGGGLQVAGSFGLAFGGAMLVGLTPQVAVTVGFVIALSSTAVVLRMLAERGERDAPHGRIALAVLLLQDVLVVPMTLLLPVLAHGGEVGEVLATLGKAALVLTLMVVVARRGVPFLLDRIPAFRTREGFLLGVATIVFLTAWAAAQAGVSPTLGAFIAGIVISDTEHRHLTLSEVAPFRELFLAVFFISVGMLLDLPAFAARPLLPLALAIGVYAVKAVLTGSVVRLLGYPGPVAVRTGADLGQIGEFSLVILLAAVSLGLLGPEVSQPLLAAAAITLLATPAVTALSRRVGNGEEGEQAPSGGEEGAAAGEGAGHVLIIGYGMGGQAVAHVLKALGLSYRVVEMNPDTVRRFRREGEPILLGDASRPETLEEAGAGQAAAAVVMINDPASLRPILVRLRRANSDLYLMVRTRFAGELEELHRLGADVVVPEELEVALQLAGMVLKRLNVAEDVRRRHLAELRNAGYALAPSPIPVTEGELPEAVEVEVFPVEEGDAACDHSLTELELPGELDVRAVGVLRDRDMLLDPRRTPLKDGDHVILSGTAAELERAEQRLKGAENAARSEQ